MYGRNVTLPDWSHTPCMAYFSDMSVLLTKLSFRFCLQFVPYAFCSFEKGKAWMRPLFAGLFLTMCSAQIRAWRCVNSRIRLAFFASICNVLDEAALAKIWKTVSKNKIAPPRFFQNRNQHRWLSIDLNTRSKVIRSRTFIPWYTNELTFTDTLKRN